MNAKETLKLVKEYDFKWPLDYCDEFAMCEVDYLDCLNKGGIFSRYRYGMTDFEFSLVCDKEYFDMVSLQYLIAMDLR
jgi:hypothetical protein